MKKSLFHILTALLVISCSRVEAPLMVEISAGTFTMGSDGEGKNYDEAPSHEVSITAFRMSEREITNAQYELYAPEHKALRDTLSAGTDDSPVTMVSWYDAVGYCKWLSRHTGRHFRLPTEAEWEFAGRPGEKENWCFDWYGEYTSDAVCNPGGPKDGEFKVTRGGAPTEDPEFLRITNRSAMMPTDTTRFIGFRIVETKSRPVLSENIRTVPLNARNVSQEKAEWTPVSADEPIFLEPITFVKNPKWEHNHQPDITWCDNGDMLAIWFSSDKWREDGREVFDLGSRLRAGSSEWEESSEFFRVPDRNLTGCSLFHGEDGTLYNINGVSPGTGWRTQAMVIRESHDNGATWSPARIIAGHNKRNQVICGPKRLADGSMIQTCDNNAAAKVISSAVHISPDGGRTWYDPWDGSAMPEELVEGAKGSSIAGIHAPVVQLKDGRLMAVGRGAWIIGENGERELVKSISSDMGKSWTYTRMAGFRPIYGGQRALLMRLREGPILFIGFTGNIGKCSEEGMTFLRKDGSQFVGHGLYAAISYDEGETWPVKKLLTDGVRRELFGWGWTWDFTMDETHAEWLGYMAGVQTPDNMIHIISSGIHYRMNLKWLETLPELQKL